MQIRITASDLKRRTGRLRATGLEYTSAIGCVAGIILDGDNDVRLTILPNGLPDDTRCENYWRPRDLRGLADCLQSIADKVEKERRAG